MQHLLLLLFAVTTVFGHGRLSVPTVRNSAAPTWKQNEPVSGNTGDDFVCRNGPETPALTINAGSSIDLQWTFDAAHVGDCAVYVSYDIDNQGSLGNSKFFKIANLFKCKDDNLSPVSVVFPDWLPAGRIVIRWDWYALHQHPSVELYSQCIDANVVSSSNLTPADIPSYSITNPPIYPANGNDGVGYRYPWSSGPSFPQFMTGPPCPFDDMTINNCALTAVGTQGSVTVTTTSTGGSGNGGVSAPPSSTPAPVAGSSSTDCPAQENYTVVSGDTLTSIALDYAAQQDLKWDVDSDAICTANELPDCDSIFVGQILIIPGCQTTHQGTGSSESGAGRTLPSALVVAVAVVSLLNY